MDTGTFREDLWALLDRRHCQLPMGAGAFLGVDTLNELTEDGGAAALYGVGHEILKELDRKWSPEKRELVEKVLLRIWANATRDGCAGRSLARAKAK